MSDGLNGGDRGAADELIRRLLAGDQRALARAITVVENDAPEASAILSAIEPHLGKAIVVGVTGPPGVGKSTLIDAFVAELRGRGRKVGVLAVDPSSPLTGGAILGDRIRMARHVDDPGVFVRSIASRGQLGGLSRTAARVLQVMEAAGPDVIIVETVGAGQSDVMIAAVAHVKIVVSAPGLGDGVQAIKAGILEIADILVVNKSDQPHADQTVRQLEAMLRLRRPGLPPVSVVSTTSTSGEGIATLADAVGAHFVRRSGELDRAGADQPLRQAIARRTAELLESRIESGRDPVVATLCDRVKRGELGIHAAAEQLLKAILAPRGDAPSGSAP